jgi:hypothetical protein
MLRQAIGAGLIIAACSLPVCAQTLTGAAGAGASAPYWNGATCLRDDECRSSRCASHWSGVRYCIRADLACAFPDSAGVLPGFTSTSEGVTHVCRRGGDWQSTKRAAAPRAKAKPLIPPADARTALNAPVDLLQPAPKPGR